MRSFTKNFTLDVTAAAVCVSITRLVYCEAFLELHPCTFRPPTTTYIYIILPRQCSLITSIFIISIIFTTINTFHPPYLSCQAFHNTLTFIIHPAQVINVPCLDPKCTASFYFHVILPEHYNTLKSFLFPCKCHSSQ